MRWQQKVLIALFGLLLLALVALYANEFYFFHRTFQVGRLLWWSALLGLALGVALGWRFSRVVEDLVERIQVYIFCIVLTTLFMPLLASLSNRLLSPHPAEWETVTFFEEKAYISERFGMMEGEKVKPRGYYLFFLRGGAMYRIDNRHRTGGTLQRGDTFDIPVRKGLWGTSWVQSDRKPWLHPDLKAIQ